MLSWRPFVSAANPIMLSAEFPSQEICSGKDMSYGNVPALRREANSVFGDKNKFCLSTNDLVPRIFFYTLSTAHKFSQRKPEVQTNKLGSVFLPFFGGRKKATKTGKRSDLPRSPMSFESFGAPISLTSSSSSYLSIRPRSFSF